MDHFTEQPTRTSVDLFLLHKDGRTLAFGSAAADEMPAWELFTRSAVARNERVATDSARVLLDQYDRMVSENKRLRQMLANQMVAGGAPNA